MNKHKYKFSITYLIPVYNDEDVINELCRRLLPVAEALSSDYEILFIDDGCKDKSLILLKQNQKQNNKIKIIKLARNFNQMNAIAAGLDNAKKDVIAILDSDLQDKPEDICKLLDAMIEKDVSLAIARWISRQDSYFKVLVSKLFHYVTNRITNVQYVPRLGMFRVLKREVVEQIKINQETTASPISLLYWMGYDFAVRFK